MNKDVDDCIEDNLLDIAYKMQGPMNKAKTKDMLCHKFSLLLHTCSDFQQIQCLSFREKNFLKDQIFDKGKWILSVMLKYFLFPDIETMASECDVSSASNYASLNQTIPWLVALFSLQIYAVL